jgi:hypothetical protein
MQGVLAEPKPDHRGGVQDHAADERHADPGQLVVAELLERADLLLIPGQGVGRLLVRALGVPHIPDRLERRRPVEGLRLAQRGGQRHQRDLGAAAEVRQHLGHAPVAVVGLCAHLLRAQRLDERGEPLV